MKLLKLNKKAIAQTISELGIAILIVIIAVVLLTILAKGKENEKIDQGKAIINEAKGENVVGLYLKYKVNIDNTEMSMVDLIVLAAHNKGKYKKLFEEQTETFFKVNTDLWIKMKIEYDGDTFDLTVKSDKWKPESGKSFLFGLGRNTFLVYNNHRDSTFYLPSYSGKPITVIIEKNYEG